MRSPFILLAIAAVLLAACPLAAQNQNNEISVSLGSADLGDFGDAGTLGIHYNRYWTGGLSTRVGVTSFGAELQTVDVGPGGLTSVGDLEMGVISAMAEYHFNRGRRFSPYVGAGVGFVSARFADTPAGDIDADDEIAGIVGGGLDVNLGRRWAINGDVTYMPYEANFGNVTTVNMDPLTLSVGAKFRW